MWMSDASVALFVYAQLAREFGWGAYKSVFRRYQSEPEVKKKDYESGEDRHLVRPVLGNNRI